MALKVFYLDDEPDLLEMFADLFSSPEIEISTSADAVAGLKRLQSEKFDVVFLDYRLPGTTGDEIAKRIPPGPTLALITGDLAVHTDFPFKTIFSKPYKREEMLQFLRDQMK
ncbi:MAG: response regulator [Bdellovibrionaceae bacterium]|nr:response regulator [Pseudobdellovibrionaceae bacterium]